METKMWRVRWCSMAIVMFSIACQSTSQPFESNASTKATSDKPRIFSPRMDYDEWTPLGRGDPLKNDPTFDYVPPVLDRVQYWLDSQSSTESSSKRDILVLGVTAKKTSPKIPNHFLKFIDGLKYTRNNYQQQQDNQENYKKDFMGSAGPEPPKIIRASNFRNGGGLGIDTNPLDFRNKNRIQNIPASYYPSPYYNEKSKPYTMMMPPPIQQPDNRYQQQHQYGMQTEEAPSILLDHDINQIVNSNPVAPRPLHSQLNSDNHEQSTTTSITLDKSNLVYQSSQTYDNWSPTTNNNNPSGQSTIWNENENIQSYGYYKDDHSAAASINHEVVVGQHANIIVDGDSVNNEQVVIGRKEIIPTLKNKSNDIININNNQLNDTKMHIVLANTSSTSFNNYHYDEQLKKVTVAVVMPSNYPEFSNNSRNYDKNTTTESTTPLTTSSMIVSPSRQHSTVSTSSTGAFKFTSPTLIKNNEHRPLQQQQQIISNPTVSTLTTQNNKINSIILTSEVSQRPGNFDNKIEQTVTSPKKIIHNQSPLAIILNSQGIKKMTTGNLKYKLTSMPTTSMTTIAPPMATSPTVTTTTDSIILSNKQSTNLIQPPMYLIIQGHSKVKTYKPIVNKYGVPIEKTSIDIESSTIKQYITKFDQFVNDNTRAVSSTRRNIVDNNHQVKAKGKRVEQDSLLSLVESGLSSFKVSPTPSKSTPS